MKQKHSFLLPAFILSTILLSAFVTACTKYYYTPRTGLSASKTYHDIILENNYWEQSPDSSFVTMDLTGFSNNLQADNVKSVTIIRKEFSVTAGYLNWGRDNQYRYEIVNSRIIVYWQTENQANIFEPVTVIIRLKQ